MADNPATQPTALQETGLPTAAIIVIAIGAYVVLVIILLIIRQACLSRGFCRDAGAGCCGKEGEETCVCCVNCSETCCNCKSPSIEACLDSICPSRRVKPVELCNCEKLDACIYKLRQQEQEQVLSEGQICDCSCTICITQNEENETGPFCARCCPGQDTDDEQRNCSSCYSCCQNDKLQTSCCVNQCAEQEGDEVCWGCCAREGCQPCWCCGPSLQSDQHHCCNNVCTTQTGQMDCADIIMCQCCQDAEGGCCNSQEPLCDCGNCNCNCQCQPPECENINCICFEIKLKDSAMPEEEEEGY